MKAVDLIRAQLDTSCSITMPLIEDLRDNPLVQPSEAGGNHAWWILGHLTFSEGDSLFNWMRGEENPVAAWATLFGGGTQPCPDGKDYPSFDEMIEAFQKLRAGNIEHLATLSDTDSDTPSKNCPEQFASFFGTAGLCLSSTSLHWVGHRGQLADIRRRLGREPMMA